MPTQQKKGDIIKCICPLLFLKPRIPKDKSTVETFVESNSRVERNRSIRIESYNTKSLLSPRYKEGSS